MQCIRILLVCVPADQHQPQSTVYARPELECAVVSCYLSEMMSVVGLFSHLEAS